MLFRVLDILHAGLQRPVVLIRLIPNTLLTGPVQSLNRLALINLQARIIVTCKLFLTLHRLLLRNKSVDFPLQKVQRAFGLHLIRIILVLLGKLLTQGRPKVVQRFLKESHINFLNQLTIELLKIFHQLLIVLQQLLLMNGSLRLQLPLYLRQSITNHILQPSLKRI